MSAFYQDPINQEDIWERLVVKQLYADYESITWMHKVRLRPCTIKLMDSQTHWGKWESETRTLSVARSLVLDHSWYHVLSVLRHEMAHQFVDEFWGGLDENERIHGQKFLRACEILGVPGPFCSAAADLQQFDLDWRKEQKTDAAEKLLDKVRKLLALATSSNEHEALLAMNKVRELYAKYNLEHHQSEASQSRYASIVICHGKKRIEAHQSKLVGILTGHFFVKAIYYKMFDPKTTEMHQAVELIGTRENVLMAEYVYYFLLKQTDLLLEEKLKSNRGKLSRIARKSFRLGILQGFQEKLAESERRKEKASGNAARDAAESAAETMAGSAGEGANVNADIGTNENSSAALAVIGRALTEFRNDSQFLDYFYQIYPRLGTRSTSTQYIDRNVYGDGKTAGKSITLNKPMTGSDGNLGKLLGPGR